MSKIMEEIRAEGRTEGIAENKKEIAVSFIKEGTVPLEKIAACVGLTIDEVKELALQLA